MRRSELRTKRTRKRKLSPLLPRMSAGHHPSSLGPPLAFSESPTLDQNRPETTSHVKRTTFVEEGRASEPDDAGREQDEESDAHIDSEAENDGM